VIPKITGMGFGGMYRVHGHHSYHHGHTGTGGGGGGLSTALLVIVIIAVVVGLLVWGVKRNSSNSDG
jgi:hypothetical protein